MGFFCEFRIPHENKPTNCSENNLESYFSGKFRIKQAIASCQEFYNPGRSGRTQTQSKQRGTGKPPSEPGGSLRPADLTDSGLAESFAAHNRNHVRHCPSYGWLTYTGTHWGSGKAQAKQCVMDFTKRLLSEALNNYKGAIVTDGETGKVTVPKDAEDFRKFAKRSRSANGIRNCLDLSEAILTIDAAELDADPYLLNTPGGIVDLHTGQITPNAPE